MKRILAAVLTVMILATAAFAQPDPTETRSIGRFGHVGLWNTLSAQTLGHSRLALNVYFNHSLDRDFVQNVWLWRNVGPIPNLPQYPDGQPGNGFRRTSNLIRDPEWQWRYNNKPTMTNLNLSIGYGVTRFLDLGVMLPIYIDNIGDGIVFPNVPGPTDEGFVWPNREGIGGWGTGNGHFTQAEIGDLELSVKFRYPPVQHNNFFQMAYYGALSFPTGAQGGRGWFPRNTYYLDERMGTAYMHTNWQPNEPALRSSVGAYNNFSSGQAEIDMKMLWTWDFREMSDNFPVLFHVNYGLRWVTQHRNDHVFFLNSALEVRPAYWLSVFADFSAAPRFGSIGQEESFAVWVNDRGIVENIGLTDRGKRGLLDDPIRLSPGISIMTPPGITVSAGFDISLANDRGVFIGDRQTSQTDGWDGGRTANGTLIDNQNVPLSTVLMETKVEPKVRFVASVGWNGLTMPNLPIITPPIQAPRDTVRLIDTVFLERLIIDTLRVEVERPATPTPTFDITASVASGQGTINPMGVNTVQQGRLVVYNITPSQGYTIGQVIVDGRDVGAVLQHTFPGVSQNHTISVIFNPIPVVEVPAPIAFEIPREGLVLRGVNFRLGSAELLPESHSALDAVVRSLKDWPEVRLEIQGHTSAEGVRSPRRVQNNLRLSRERAYSVMRYFIQAGIAPHQLRAVGMGEEFPIASNDTEAGRELNRRVTLVRIED